MSTYTPIATQTLGSAAATITFSSLPQNYTDLIVVYNATSSTDDQNYVQFNGDTGSNYSRTFITGNGSSATSSRSSNDTKLYGPFSVSVPTVNIIQVQNYSNGATFKTSLIRSGAANNSTIATVGLWRSTAPITSILIGTNSGTFNSGTVFTIYGVAAGNSSAKASGGNIVTTDGSYWYHTFTSSGVFIPNEALSADVLVVAGGGSGGQTYGGGGGGGGLCYQTSRSLSANSIYTTVIGAGGSNGGNGNNSIFDTITAIGGGGGGSQGGGLTRNGQNGGSGGGAGYPTGGDTPGSATQGNSGGATGYGFAGGGVTGPVSYAATGGGGGAGSVGGTGNNGNGNSGNGGTGRTYSISGTSIGYAGGGGGGTQTGAGITAGTGTDGGGNGGKDSNIATAGAPNRGGGGGGAGYNGGIIQGAAGGSGVVIIRYAV